MHCSTDVVTESPRSNELLLVDDDAGVRRFLRRMVRDIYPRLDVREATCGEEALMMLGDEVVCVVTDISMPGLDGLRLCRMIRHDPEWRSWRDVPVILMSGFRRDDELTEQAWSAGTALMLSKPFTPEQLGRLIHGCTGIAPTQSKGWEPVLSREEMDAVVELIWTERWEDRNDQENATTARAGLVD